MCRQFMQLWNDMPSFERIVFLSNHNRNTFEMFLACFPKWFELDFSHRERSTTYVKNSISVMRFEVCASVASRICKRQATACKARCALRDLGASRGAEPHCISWYTCYQRSPKPMDIGGKNKTSWWEEQDQWYRHPTTLRCCANICLRLKSVVSSAFTSGLRS